MAETRCFGVGLREKHKSQLSYTGRHSFHNICCQKNMLTLSKESGQYDELESGPVCVTYILTILRPILHIMEWYFGSGSSEKNISLVCLSRRGWSEVGPHTRKRFNIVACFAAIAAWELGGNWHAVWRCWAKYSMRNRRSAKWVLTAPSDTVFHLHARTEYYLVSEIRATSRSASSSIRYHFKLYKQYMTTRP